ncbi:hypothetical protein B484DRAFT_393585 [Ochromonadaceae sp. CCMP2298]|nr:hypothetical protein B484DRAFT_393585 [Ochromonadaceae sp. CCMP2298]
MWRGQIVPLLAVQHRADRNNSISSDSGGSGGAGNSSGGSGGVSESIRDSISDSAGSRSDGGSGSVSDSGSGGDSGGFAYQECVLGGLQALMFLSGRNLRPDVGLEVAKTIRRRRAWLVQGLRCRALARYPTAPTAPTATAPTGREVQAPPSDVTTPASTSASASAQASAEEEFQQVCGEMQRAYSYGKKLRGGRAGVGPIISEFLSQGLENSILLELGVLGQARSSSSRAGIERIRIQLK